MKKTQIQSQGEIIEHNPRLNKPVIAILNTQGANDAARKTGTDKLNDYYGSHWLTFGYITKRICWIKTKTLKGKERTTGQLKWN